MAENDVPRFGQRSEQWTPDGSGAASGGGDAGSGGGETSEGTSSWPQYGQLEQDAQSPQPTWGQYPHADVPAGDVPPSPAQPGVSGPYGTPVQLPSRAWAIALIVLGAVATFIVSGVVFLAVLSSGINIGAIVGKSTIASTGSSVNVDDSGSILVFTSSTKPLTCALVDSSGQETALVPTANTPTLLGHTDLTPGNYTLNCGEGTSDLNVITGTSPEQMVTAVMHAFWWGTVVGVFGVVVFIVGIVKLVRVNRKRAIARQTAR